MANRSLQIPKGASFNLATGQWFIAQPTEPRPFFEALKRGSGQNFSILVGGPNDAYVFILPLLEDGQSTPAERLTHAEYASLQGPLTSSPELLEPNGDAFMSGPGPMLGMTVVADREPVLSPNERGLVLMAGIEKASNGELISTAGVNASETRTALFLWDKLDWPRSSLIDVPVSAEAAFLLDAGVMVRTDVINMGPLHSKQGLVDLHESAFAQLERVEPGRWSIGHGASAQQPDGSELQRSLIVDLHGILAIPDVNVPLEEVLSFREKRRAELAALRSYIDDLYEAVAKAPDRAHAIVAAHDKLVAAVAAQRKVLQETGWVSKLSGLTVDVKLTDYGAAASAAMATYAATNSVIAAGKGASLGFGMKVATKLGTSSGTAPELKYVLSIDRTFGGRHAMPD